MRPPLQLDMLWVDFGAGSRLATFLGNWWRHVRQGGHVLVHSTLTNRLTRSWLEEMRALGHTASPLTPAGGLGSFGGGESEDGEDGDDVLAFETSSFREPHKLFQNSFSLFQKRGQGFAEPVFTNLP